ncbi:unnamed protein product [Closterium sp. NIES-64]|nr:unnamed protein product [Closterium sp. NIES-64]
MDLLRRLENVAASLWTKEAAAAEAGQWGWRAGEEGLFERLGEEASRLRAMLEGFNRAAPNRGAPAGVVEEDGAGGEAEEAGGVEEDAGGL